jgi:guanylate kinase
MPLNKKGKLLVFSAPSGSGKTTIVKKILKLYPDLGFSISATTRKKRETETNGAEYFFITEEEFKEKIKAGAFIEWEKFYDYYYGTPEYYIEEILKKGKSVVLELDVKGAISIKEEYPEALLIFIMPPGIEELKKRLKSRKTESDEDFKKRIERAEMELTYKDHFDYIVVNRDIKNAVNEVIKIIENKI